MAGAKLDDIDRKILADIAVNDAAGFAVLAEQANPKALTDKVAQQVPQWAELFKKAGVQAQ